MVVDALASDQTFTGTTDGVPPAIIAAQVLDDDKDGQIDQILVTLSEAISRWKLNFGQHNIYRCRIHGE